MDHVKQLTVSQLTDVFQYRLKYDHFKEKGLRKPDFILIVTDTAGNGIYVSTVAEDSEKNSVDLEEISLTLSLSSVWSVTC